jgi:hypothetical protein
MPVCRLQVLNLQVVQAACASFKKFAGSISTKVFDHPRSSAELPTVLRNDEVVWCDLLQRIQAGEWHNIVISPGPGTPEREADVGEAHPPAVASRYLVGRQCAAAIGGCQ